MIAIRFLLRFLLVPLGGLGAAMAAATVVCFAHLQQFLKLVANDPTAPENIILAAILVGPSLVIIMSIGAFAMLTPATIGVVISEIFAIRSILYHLANGALASWIGWVVMADFLRQYEFFKEPTPSIAAGIAAGFVYWAIAGWNAGFWKPVFAPPAPPPSTTVAAQKP